MKNIHLTVPDKDYAFFIRLVKSFDFVEVKDAKEERPPSKKEFLEGMREAVEEVKMIKAWKKKGKPFQQLLDEL